MVMRRSGLLSVIVASRLEDGEGVGGIDVGHAIGHEDDVVVGTGVVATGAIGKLDAQIEAGLDIGGISAGEPVNGAGYIGVVGIAMPHRVPVKDIAAELDDGDAVLAAEAVPDGLGGLAGDGYAVALVHGAGSIQHKGHIDGCGIVVCLGGLEGDAGHVHATVQRMSEHVAGDGEAVIA